MELKVGRNEPCPCGSKKKYKKCCMDKQDSISINIKDDLELKKGIEKLIKDSRVKQCLHPLQEECSEDIIKAHSIQNNGILSKVSENGKLTVIKPSFTREGVSIEADYKGRKIASTFTGFCGKHDKVFSDIENKPYEKKSKQNFLLAYRAFAFEAHRKAEATNIFGATVAQRPSILKDETQLMIYRGYQAAMADNLYLKKIFDKAIVEEDYHVIQTLVIEVEGEALMAACSSIHLEYDLKGNQLNVVTSIDTTETLKPLMINVFPQHGKTFVVFCWLKEDSIFYSNFISQLNHLEKEEMLLYVSNLIVSYTENFYINPAFWETFSNKEKNAIYRYFEEDMTHFRFGQKRNLMKQSGFNMFKNLL